MGPDGAKYLACFSFGIRLATHWGVLPAGDSFLFRQERMKESGLGGSAEVSLPLKAASPLRTPLRHTNQRTALNPFYCVSKSRNVRNILPVHHIEKQKNWFAYRRAFRHFTVVSFTKGFRYVGWMVRRGDSQGGMAWSGSETSMPPLSRLLIDFLAGTRKPPPEADSCQRWYLFIINGTPDKHGMKRNSQIINLCNCRDYFPHAIAFS